MSGAGDKEVGTGATVGRWVESLRGPREKRDPRRPGGWQVEAERAAGGDLVPVLVVFLANRECPWRCVYCDLWGHALEHGVAPGDVPHQVETAVSSALGRFGAETPRQVKLYNAGSFFDPRAIPSEDHAPIAERVRMFDRVIVECHPALVGDAVFRFRDVLARGGGGRATSLEVAMGLETINPAVLPRLNKGMTVEGFARAAERLRAEGVDLRAFVLVQPPYEAPGEAVRWARESTEFALGLGAIVVSLIPVRGGNGAMEALQAEGLFSPPTLDTFEAAVDASLAGATGRGRIFADLWNLERFSACAACFPARRARLARLNATQTAVPRVKCSHCS